MQPKYGFDDRKSINQNYTKPVSLDNHEWVYAQCRLPFYSTPTTRLHFHAQPLPEVSTKTKEKANVVFIQFDTLGRQAMYRRMPRSYKLLTTYKYVLYVVKKRCYQSDLGSYYLLRRKKKVLQNSLSYFGLQSMFDRTNDN